jgi:hypothetical protein
LVEGHILISNFNDGANLQGTGTTIVEISPSGNLRQFARIDANKVNCPGGVGLTTALAALDSGFVIVGSLPTTDGTSATAEAGCLIVLSSNGDVVETFTAPYINGPWDSGAIDPGNREWPEAEGHRSHGYWLRIPGANRCGGAGDRPDGRGV